MSENSNEFNIDFTPKTDQTFIAPNENFNTFSHNFCNNFGLQKKDEKTTDSRNVANDTKTDIDLISKRKTPSDDTFIDFVVKQYKSDGFVCTLDENDRQIYYCYCCHQYVNDFDLIPDHIHSSLHFKNILNGISFKRGLDKEFVIESASNKDPKDAKNFEKAIAKELHRIPFHLKHYYFRNGIRLKDVLSKNHYFCKSCDESIPNLKSIDAHLSTDKHIANKQKPTLMQIIDKTDDPVLKIGLQFINEEKIADSSMVYECELCNCLDCNTDKMFAHIKSLEHRIKLLERYNYDPTDLNLEEVENLVKELHDKHGSGAMKVGAKANKKVRFNIDSTPQTNSQKSSPSEESEEKMSQKLPPIPTEPQNLQFLKRDRFLSDFKEHKIIETFESDGREVYYCCYCDEYFNSFVSMEKHIGDTTHERYQSREKNSSKGINKKFSMKRSKQTIDDSDESLDERRLEKIPLTVRHYYFKRGIKHKNEDEYYCRLCQTNIESFEKIEHHFRLSETHMRIEERPNKFNDLLFQTSQPIIGLKFIEELSDENSKQIRFKCILCDYVQDFCQMFVHLNCYSHQFKVLKKLSPKNKVFKEVKETEPSFKSSELLKKEISKIEEEVGCGFVSFSPDSKSTTIHNTNDKVKSADSLQYSRSPPSPFLSPVIRNECTDRPLDKESPKECSMTEEEMVSYLEALFAVTVDNEDEVPILVNIIESLKNSLFAYYKAVPEKTTLSANDEAKPIKNSDSSNDNYEVCEMDES